MGGSGSGRRGSCRAKDTTENYQALDVRWLKREGVLSSGATHRVTWSRRGKVVATIHVEAEPGYVILTYRHKKGGSDWKTKRYPVYLTTTPCHMGGERHWFLCPGPGCGQRVAVLYGGPIFACRKCHQLAYASQRTSAKDRVTQRTNRIRHKLGWPAGIFNRDHWGKPKGMHWRTYERLRQEHDVLKDKILIGLAADLKQLKG